MILKSLIFIIFGMSLLGCPSSSPNAPSSSQKGDAVNSQGQLSPIWQQTEYIFYNKTGGQVTVIYVEEGKLRKKGWKCGGEI